MQDSITAVILYDESKPGERAVQIMEVEARRKETCQGLFWNFFDWINKGSFEVSADAFNTFRVCVSPAVITALLNDKRTS
jgi:calcium binding protein 39